MARKAEAIDLGGYFEEEQCPWMRFDDGLCDCDIPETARTSIIRHSLMSMIPSESSICLSILGTTICFVPWSGY